MNKPLFCSASKLSLAVFILAITNSALLAQTVTIAPTADAFVRNGTYGNINYGSNTSLIVKGSPTSGFLRSSYLKFPLGAITNVRSAKVRLYGLNKDNTSTINVTLFGVNDDSWTETGITFNNAPAAASSLSSVGITNVAGYYEFDVTDFVKAQLTGDKVVSVVVKDITNSDKTISFNSKENSQNAPQLVVDTTVVIPTITLAPIADAFVRNGTYGNINYGTDTSLIVKGSPTSGFLRSSYLKFSLGTVANVRSATVRLYGFNKDNTSTINVALLGVNDDSWTETGITFNNAPAASSTSLSSVGVNNVAGYYEFDVTNFVKAQLTGDKVVSILVKDTTIKDKTISFNSKENSHNPPQLVVDTTTVTGSQSNALIFVENPDKFPSNNHFVFAHIQIPWTRDSVYNANHDSLKVRIHNNGINSLTISNLKISTDTLFKIDKLNGVMYDSLTQLPVTVSSGGVLDLMVKFIAKNVATRAKVLNESLTITSNDDINPVKKVFLDGLWQYSGEGIHEPYSQEVITTFGYKTKTGFGGKDPDKGDSTKLKGDEVKPDYFLRADTSFPVAIRQLAAYHNCCHSVETFRWFLKGTTTYNSVFSQIGLDGQSLLPRRSTSGLAAGGTITPSGAFGVIIGSNNTTDPSRNPGGKLGVRVYKALDASGNIIPNAYILANDYLGTTSTNYDYNDNMYYVSNIKPYIGTVYYSPLNVTPSDVDFGEKVLQTNNSIQLNISSGGQIYSNGSQDPALVISSVAITGENQSEFSADMPLKTTLNPQEATTINVKFNPATQGLKIADLLIYYNNSQSPKRVPLYGIAKASGVTVTANYRVNSGASSPITINGKTWAADNQYSFDNLEPYKNPAVKQIAATDEDSLYIDEQSSNGDKKPFRYQFPVANGDYYVRLHFAEIFWGAPGSGLTGGAGSRVFSVKLENQYRLINYDLTQDVGGAAAVIKNFPVSVTDGNLNIDFSATVNRPMVSAVEVYSFSSGSSRPALVAAIQNNSQVNVADYNFEKPRLYPNPLHNKNFNIAFPGKYNGVYDLELIDILGRKYDLGKTRLNEGGSTIKMDISRFSLKPGVYFLKINSNANKADVLKLLIE